MRSRALATALLATVAWIPATAAAAPPRPADLAVVGGEGWHAENKLWLTWAIPPGGELPAATLWRIHDPLGATISSGRLAWAGDGIGPIELPRVPGVYGAEVWFEDAGGTQGPPAAAALRFDDTRPAAVEPGPVEGWIGRSAFPLRIDLGPPAGAAPISGIRGYAVAIGAAPGVDPCASPHRCTESETSVRGRVGRLEIDDLPEGVSYLRVAAVSGAGMKSPTSGPVQLRVDTTDPLTRLRGAPAGWTDESVRLTASASDGGSGMVRSGAGPVPFTAIRIDGDPPTTASGESVGAVVIEEGIHRVAYYARDAAGNIDDGGQGNAAPRIATVRIDRTPPAVAFSGSPAPFDPELLRVRVVDPLSGMDAKRGWIGVRRLGSGDGFEPLANVPAPATELRARWSSDRFPPGEYEFRAVAYDAAGNASATTRRRNGEPMVLSNPLKATTVLSAGFGREGSRRTVPYGRRILVDGRLRSGRAAPLAGRTVKIVERFAAGAGTETRVSSAVTGARGEFSVRTAPGPSRTIAVSFEGSPTLGRSTSRTLELGVRSRVQLGASAGVATVGGPPLVFRGRLIAPAETIPPSGRTLQLQFRLPGLPWAEFRTVQTDGRGRFRYAYRFSDDDSRGARFQFRAFAPVQENWPYEPAGSRPVLVHGR